MQLYHAKLSYWKFSTRIDFKYSKKKKKKKKKNMVWVNLFAIKEFLILEVFSVDF